MLAAGCWTNGKLFALPGDSVDPGPSKQPEGPKQTISEPTDPSKAAASTSGGGKPLDAKAWGAEAPRTGFTLSPALAAALPKPGCVCASTQRCVHPTKLAAGAHRLPLLPPQRLLPVLTLRPPPFVRTQPCGASPLAALCAPCRDPDPVRQEKDSFGTTTVRYRTRVEHVSVEEWRAHDYTAGNKSCDQGAKPAPPTAANLASGAFSRPASRPAWMDA